MWLKVHVTLALTLGFLFALLGLTGSLSIYREELDAALNPRLTVDSPQGQYLSLDRIMAAVQAAHPSRHGEWVLEMPRSPLGMVTAWYERPHETFGEYYAPLMVSVNPYSGEVVASRFWGQTFATWVEDLHTQLQMGLSGARLVGILGLGLVVSILSGLYLWIVELYLDRLGFKNRFGLRQSQDRGGSIRQRQAFTLRQGQSRFAHDAHGLLGLASALILLLLAFTGLHLAYPKMLETLAGASGMGHGEEGAALRSTAAHNNRPVSLVEAVAIARGLFPHAEIRRVATPAGEDGTYRVNLRRPGEVNIRHPVTLVWIDRWSGQIRDVRNPNKFTSGQTFVSSLWPLHTGEYYGAWGRPLWFFAGLAPLLLYVTGLVQWLVKRGLMRDRALNGSSLRILRGILMKKLFLSVLAVFLLVEEWLWDMLTALGRHLTVWLHLAAFERWLGKASPNVAMAAFVFPVILILPVKFAALLLFSHGQFAQGITLLLAAKLFATLLISLMFAITRPQLLTFAWFHSLYSTITRWLSWAHERLRATWVYQQATQLKLAAKAKLAAWLRDGEA